MFDWASGGPPAPSFSDSRTVTPSVVSQPQRSFGTSFSETPMFTSHTPPQPSPSPDTLTAASIASIPVVSPVPRPCMPAMPPVPAPVDPAASRWTHQHQSDWARASPMPTAAFPVPQSCDLVTSPPPIRMPSAITHPSAGTYQSWHAPSPAVPNLSPKFPVHLTPTPFPPALPAPPTVSPSLSAAPMVAPAPSVAIPAPSIASVASTPAHRTRNAPSSYEQPQLAPHDQGASRGIGIFGKYGRQVVSLAFGS
ncbi:hypothetical protein FRC06_006457 [Ceratobasidium sp. 370]|nr:hypothetical protein FRC06_006457 [Ceratobasidium sp. 370]